MRITPWFALDILLMVLFSFGVMILFNIANIYYLKKLRINKWILLGISIGLIILSQVFTYYNYRWFISLIPFLLGIFFLVWFFDVHRNPKLKKAAEEKQIINRPKAKPNRAKKAEIPAQNTAPKKKNSK